MQNSWPSLENELLQFMAYGVGNIKELRQRLYDCHPPYKVYCEWSQKLEEPVIVPVVSQVLDLAGDTSNNMIAELTKANLPVKEYENCRKIILSRTGPTPCSPALQQSFVGQLGRMGYTEEESKSALAEAGYDLNLAVEILCSKGDSFDMLVERITSLGITDDKVAIHHALYECEFDLLQTIELLRARARADDELGE